MTKAPRYRPGHLEKRQTSLGPCWYFRTQVTTDGKRVRSRIRIGLVSEYHTKAAAMRAASSIREEVNAPPGAREARERLFEDVIARYEREEMPQRAITRRNYQKLLRHIRPAWGRKRLSEVRPLVVRAWLTKEFEPGRYRGHMHDMMKRLFKFAMLCEWIPEQEMNPMSKFSMPGSSKRKQRPRIITVEQFYSLVDELPAGPVRTGVLIAGCLGLRCSEIFGLKWSDINFHKGELSVLRSYVEGHVDAVKTEYSKKDLPLHPDLLGALLMWRQHSDFKEDTDWVFASPQMAGKQPYYPNNLQLRILRPAGERIGLDFNMGWHTLRHSFKTWLDERGVELTVQRDLMRHADVRTTAQVYGDVDMKRLRGPSGELAERLLRRPQ